MASPGTEPFLEFAPQAVAARIRAQSPAVPLPPRLQKAVELRVVCG